MNYSTLDIFCAVIDNFGDIGVVYRFARAFKRSNPDIRIRVFVDDLVTFNRINRVIDCTKVIQTVDSIIYVDSNRLDNALLDHTGVAEVIIEAFACQIPESYMKRAYHESVLLINLDHLSAEEWVEEYHLKESLLPEGILRKFFFMPGFSQKTGGLIIDQDEINSQKNNQLDKRILQSILPETCAEYFLDQTFIKGTVFTYTRGFDRLIEDCLSLQKPVCLLVFGHKSTDSLNHALEKYNTDFKSHDFIVLKDLRIQKMPFVSQQHYDILLRNADFNIVRGEDSLVRAILAGKPFLWNAYIQEKSYQTVKVKALCAMMRSWFGDEQQLYTMYYNLMMELNSAAEETPTQVTSEQFLPFFQNLKKIEHIFSDISYFMTQNCDLVKNLTTFIRDYPYNIR